MWLSLVWAHSAIAVKLPHPCFFLPLASSTFDSAFMKTSQLLLGQFASNNLIGEAKVLSFEEFDGRFLTNSGWQSSENRSRL
jgi:hypothetical protein